MSLSRVQKMEKNVNPAIISQGAGGEDGLYPALPRTERGGEERGRTRPRSPACRRLGWRGLLLPWHGGTDDRGSDDGDGLPSASLRGIATGTAWSRAVVLLGGVGGGCRKARTPPKGREFLWRARQDLGNTLGLLSA